MLTPAVFLEFCLGGGEGLFTKTGRSWEMLFFLDSVWRGGGDCLQVGAGMSVGNAIFPGIPSGGGGGCLQVGTGVRVEKFLEFCGWGKRGKIP